LLRLPNFSKGDFVKYNNLTAQLNNFDGNKNIFKGFRYTSTLIRTMKASRKLDVVARKDDIKNALVSAKSPDIYRFSIQKPINP
jgi:NMD protein affecting ribosome stability and mRNA decay